MFRTFFEKQRFYHVTFSENARMKNQVDVIARSFTAGQAAKATGVPYNQLNYWATSGFLVPSINEASGSNTCRAYDFRDLVAIRVAAQLRDAGIALQGLRRVVTYLQKLGYKRPLADAYLVVTGNGDVAVMKGSKMVSALRQAGQAYFVFALGETVKELKLIAAKLKPPSRGKACAVA
jgi:DNA-binding transcriptional MerR regulator